jgi:hypothetical protein
MRLDGGRFAPDRSRTDGLVGLLGILGLGLEQARRVRQIRLTITLGDIGADLGDRFLGQIHRVGPHVGDETDRARTDIHALVELLGHAHGALGGEAELARRLLLERGGDEGRGRLALALFALDLLDPELARRRRLQRDPDLGGTRLVDDGELLDLLTAEAGQPGDEGAFILGRVGLDGPVLALDEGFDLDFALADQTQCRTLHPSGRESAPDLLPQQRREIEADQIVERPPCLLGVDEVIGDLARVGDGLLDRALGDLVEDHPKHRALAELAAALEQLVDMPGDGLALTVGVGGQIERLAVLELLGDGLDVLLVALDDLIFHREAVVRIDRPLLGDEIAHMAIGGHDLEAGSEVLLDGLGLGGRFDDDEIHAKQVDSVRSGSKCSKSEFSADRPDRRRRASLRAGRRPLRDRGGS